MDELNPNVDDDPWLGRVLSERYRIEERIGDGAMGAVYRAVHQNIKKTVAIKILKGEFTARDDQVSRFRREAQAAANIEHPHICAAFDFAQTEEGAYFLALEYLHGQTLEEVMARDQILPASRAVHIAEQICSGLHAAHELGIVHRDLKPGNIMLIEREGERDFVKLLDFGIARVESDDSDVKLTVEGMVYGTPQYLSPEQASGSLELDHRADFYALGMVLFEMLTGAPPFVSDSPMLLLSMHITRTAPSLSESGLDLPQALVQLVGRLLEKLPDDRPQSAREIRQALAAIGSSRPQPIHGQLEGPLAGEDLSTTTGAEADAGPAREGEAVRSGAYAEVSSEIIRLVPAEIAIRHQALPLRREGERLWVAMTRPDDHGAIQDIAFLTGFSIEAVPARGEELSRALLEHYGRSPSRPPSAAPSAPDSHDIRRSSPKAAEGAPVRMRAGLLFAAIAALVVLAVLLIALLAR